jgi:CubicO group peptidase (beta-lactamase class C family)
VACAAATGQSPRAPAGAFALTAPLDAVLGVPARWAAGFLRNVSGIYGESEAAYGHGGWGGSFAFANPDRRLGFAYTMNRMGTDLIGDPRNIALIAASSYSALPAYFAMRCE